MKPKEMIIFLILGYDTVAHPGYLFGYNAQLTVLPDVDIGVFMALNGLDYTYLARLLTHAFIIDLALGEEPWLNSATVCTFPYPWVSGAEVEEVIQKIASLDDGPGHRFTKPR